MRDDSTRFGLDDADAQEIFRAVKDFLEQTAASGVIGQVDPGTPLLNSSLDSLTVLQLMMFLSERFRFELQEEDFVEEHFGTVAALVRRIAARRETT